MRIVKAAGVQLSPVLYNREGTAVEKVVRKIHELGQQGVQFATFPETVVPYYPYFSFVQSAYQIIAGGEHLKLLNQAVTVPSPATNAISEAKEAGIVVSIGINELMKGELQAIREGTCALSCSAADSAEWAPCDTSRRSCGGAQMSRSLS
jgi:aliphatic nitrilase